MDTFGSALMMVQRGSTVKDLMIYNMMVNGGAIGFTDLTVILTMYGLQWLTMKSVDGIGKL